MDFSLSGASRSAAKYEPGILFEEYFYYMLRLFIRQLC